MAKTSKLMRNKKGLDYYVATITIMSIFLLGFVVYSLFTKDYHLRSGLALGTEQFRILKTYANAEKALLFVDDSARLALEQAAYALGKSGFFYPDLAPPCGAQKDSSGKVHALWAKDNILPENKCAPEPESCYPEEGEMKPRLIKLFEGSFRKSIDSFNSKSDVKIPFDYKTSDSSSFDLPTAVGRTLVKGVSNTPITIRIPGINYEVKPGFKESLPFDIIGNGKETIGWAKQMTGLSRRDTEEKVSELNDARKLKWALDGYWSAKKTCPYDTKEPCSFACGSHTECTKWNVEGCTSVGEIVPDGEEEEEKCKCLNSRAVTEYCSGTYQKTISYEESSSLLSASEAAKLLSYNEAAGKPELKGMEYDFGLSWITVTGCTQTCSGREAKPC